MVYGTPMPELTINLTLYSLQSGHIFHGKPYARVDLIPYARVDFIPQSGLWIWPQFHVAFYSIRRKMLT
jgi:hypothetical protein